MKKIAAGMMAVVMIVIMCCSCGSNSSASTKNQETPVALGYSLNQFGLKIDSADLLQKECTYQQIDINGKCTEIYGKKLGREVKVAVVQGFYKRDLKNGDVLIANKTYDPNTFENEVVYEDNDIIVYDISNMIYQDTLEDRVAALDLTDDSSQSFGAMLYNCASDLDVLIVKNNPVPQRPSDTQEIKRDPAIQL